MPRHLAETKRSDFSSREARRIALAAQGFDRRRCTGRVGLSDLRRVIRQLGLLQIDYFNVLGPRSTRFCSRVSGLTRCRCSTTWYTVGASSPSSGPMRPRSFPSRHGPCSAIEMAVHRVRPYGFEKFLESSLSTSRGYSTRCGSAGRSAAATFRNARESRGGSSIPGSAASGGRCSKPISAAARSRWPTAGPTSPACTTSVSGSSRLTTSVTSFLAKSRPARAAACSGPRPRHRHGSGPGGLFSHDGSRCSSAPRRVGRVGIAA